MTHTDFFASLYALPVDEEGNVDASDLVIGHLHDLLLAGRFKDVDKILGEVDVERLGSTALVAFVVVSNWARDRLPSRPALLDRTEKRLVALKDAEYAAELMVGMRGDKMDPGVQWSLDVLSPFLGEIPK